ncbi:UNVERIFIED_CONTAM: hypothetical protein Slati_3637800 [Sesamum latifolium]|uniref:Serine aminopeptidase S33 domain-containing protein n=1 Tax=Sesamum latifolium TaxID=2727402 RepID=A0AAW2TZM2_9LAMI
MIIVSNYNVSAAMQQKVTILNKRGEKLSGVLHETGSEKIVVLCHGFRSSKDNTMMVNLAAALENEGISAFRFDFSGNGESEGPFHYGNYSGETEDLRSVIEYFSGVNRSTVAVLGHSKGGNIVLLYASKYGDIGAVVNVCGRYDPKKGIEERLGKDFLETIKKEGHIDVKTRSGDYRVTEESLMERLNTNMHEACLSIDERCRDCNRQEPSPLDGYEHLVFSDGKEAYCDCVMAVVLVLYNYRISPRSSLNMFIHPLYALSSLGFKGLPPF